MKNSKSYLPDYPDSTLLVANEVLEKASKLGNEEIIARANYKIGVAYYYQNKPILSQSYYQKVLDSPYIDKDLILKEYVLNNMGINYELTSEYVKGLDVYQESIKLAENRGDSVSVAQT